MRLLAMLIVAGAVVWGAGQAADRLDAAPELPSADAAHKVIELVQQLVPVSEHGQDVATTPSDPLGDSMAEPRPDTGRAPQEAPLVVAQSEPLEVVAPEPFVPDSPEPVMREPLDRSAANTVISRLDRVMSLAAGKER